MAADNRVIIVGGGHNGLVAAGYLAGAGLTVQVLERREVLGGAAVTEEWFPGYRLSTCSMLVHGLRKKVIDDLELHKYGYQVYPFDPVRVFPFPNGNIVRMWNDDDKTAEEIRKISPHDADAWHEWMDFWQKADRIVGDFALSTPPTLSQLVEKAKGMGEEEVLETLMMIPLKDLYERYFESEEVRALAGLGIDQGDISAPGGAFEMAVFMHRSFREDSENFGLVRGGMGSISQSMARSAEARGASIRTSAEVRRILTENGRVTGVELVDGEVISSDIVVSNADPKRTFLKLVDSADLDEDFLTEVRAIKTNAASVKFHCALRELPDFSPSLGAEYDPKELATMQFCPSTDYFLSSWEDARNGRVARTPVILVTIPSVYDPTMAPEGHHVMSMWAFYQPPHLKDGSWADVRLEVGERLIDELSKYAPNLRDTIIDWDIMTPEDIEERIGLTDGNIRHIDMSIQQLMNRRPLPGWSDYRTPVQGLYLCGAGTHPGGEVTGAPGHNAAHVILKDCGLDGS
jgi:phytoene dehydrogenase-like protein